MFLDNLNSPILYESEKNPYFLTMCYAAKAEGSHFADVSIPSLPRYPSGLEAREEELMVKTKKMNDTSEERQRILEVPASCMLHHPPYSSSSMENERTGFFYWSN